MTIHKILKYLALVIGLIGLFFLGRVLVAGDDAIETSADLQASVVNPFLYVAYFVLAFVIVLVLIFVIKGLFRGNIKNTLIPIVAFAAVVLIAFLLADGGEVYDRNDVMQVNDSESRWVSTGLITFYILAILAIGMMLISGVRKLIK